MKKITTLFFLFALINIFVSCQNSSPEPVKQKTVVDSLLDHYFDISIPMPNEMQKEEFKEKYIDTIHSYFKDSLNYLIGNIKVKIKEISNRDFGGMKAFYVVAEDANENEYYYEYDYQLKDSSKLRTNPVYKTMKDIPEYTDTTLFMFYLGSTKWGISSRYDWYKWIFNSSKTSRRCEC